MAGLIKEHNLMRIIIALLLLIPLASIAQRDTSGLNLQ